MIGSLFRFHVYYQTRRILKEISAALLQDASWNAFSNSYDQRAYERICKEFNVDVNADWRQKQSENQGLGTIYNYWTNDGFHPLGKGVQYDNKSYSFTQSTTNEKIQIDYISQGSEVSKVWSKFVTDNAKSSTRAGVERINDSILTYCWAIFGSQSQT